MMKVVGYEGRRHPDALVSWGTAAVRSDDLLVNPATGLRRKFEKEDFERLCAEGAVTAFSPFKVPEEFETHPMVVLETRQGLPGVSKLLKLDPGRLGGVVSSGPREEFYVIIFQDMHAFEHAAGDIIERLLKQLLYEKNADEQRDKFLKAGFVLNPHEPVLNALRVVFTESRDRDLKERISLASLRTDEDRIRFRAVREALLSEARDYSIKYEGGIADGEGLDADDASVLLQAVTKLHTPLLAEVRELYPYLEDAGPSRFREFKAASAELTFSPSSPKNENSKKLPTPKWRNRQTRRIQNPLVDDTNRNEIFRPGKVDETMSETAQERGYTEFTDVAPELGEHDDYAAAVARLDDCYTKACEGTPYTIYVRPGRQGECSGLYAETPRGLQILGGTISVPEDVAEIQRAAWELFCEGESTTDDNGNAIAGAGQYSHEVPSSLGRVVLMRDGAHPGTEVYRTTAGFRFIWLDYQHVSTAERCVLIRMRGVDVNSLSEPFAVDCDSPDGLALLGLNVGDVAPGEVLWDSHATCETHTIITIDELLKKVTGGLVRNDRGNGSAGPIALGERHELDEDSLAEVVHLVSEDQDPDAWRLAREALSALGGGAPEHVAIDAPNARPGEYCAVYAG